MKQILFILILAAVAYAIFWGGAVKVLYKADIKPQDFISSIASKVEDTDFVPEIATARKEFNYTNKNSFSLIKNNLFLTYDPELCFALLDIAYSSNAPEAEAMIKEYLKMFTLPEDKSKILGLLSAYKDKQTMKIILSLYDSNSLDKANLLNILANYHTPEVAQLINRETTDSNQLISQIANQLATSFKDQEWFKEGSSFLNNNNTVAKKQNEEIDKRIDLQGYMGEQ